MLQLVKAIKRKVRRWQSGTVRLRNSLQALVSSFVGSIVLAFALAFSLSFSCLWPLIFIAVPFVIAMWKFALKPLHPLVRQLGSLEEGKRREALEQLLQMGDEAIPLFLQALNAPAEFAPSGDWCGFYAHRLAVEGLGRLKAKLCTKVLINALKHKDAGVKANAVWALAEIGAEEAIPELIPLLFYRAETTDRENTQLEESVRRSAKEALRKLGEGELVETLLRVLGHERDEEAVDRLRQWMPLYRSAIVKALLSAVRGSNLFEASQAAWALGKLNAVEALPVLERLALSFRTPHSLRQYCQEAVSWLRTVATLPSPADLTRINAENLPSIPDPQALSTDTLPSPATPPEKAIDRQCPPDKLC